MGNALTNHLDEIRDLLLRMSRLTERNFDSALRAVIERRSDLAEAVVEEDSEIDSLEVQVDEMVVACIATRGPLARDCRFMLTASKLGHDLERIADESTTISRRARELNREPALMPLVEVPEMGIIAQEMLRDSIRCFVEYDAELAIDVIARDKTVDSIYKGFVRDITTLMTKDSKAICRALHLLTVSKAIERVADHATNIAEEVYYFLKGQDIRHDPFAGKNGGMD